jgi:hypothetical protein
MNFIDFVQFVKTQCMYETIYEDSDGNLILVIRMLDAYAMANKMSEKRWPSAVIGKETLQDALARENGTPPQRTWVNLTSEEIGEIYRVGWANNMELARAIEAKLKEKNVGTL